MQIGFKFSDLNGLSPKFNKEKSLARKGWVRDFRKRYGLTLCAPKECSMGRNTRLDGIQCQRFFKNFRACC